MERNIIINDAAIVPVQYLSQILYNLFAPVELRPSFDIERNIHRGPILWYISKSTTRQPSTLMIFASHSIFLFSLWHRYCLRVDLQCPDYCIQAHTHAYHSIIALLQGRLVSPITFWLNLTEIVPLQPHIWSDSCYIYILGSIPGRRLSHTATQNPFMYSFSGNCSSLSLNFHIQVSLSDWYIPRIGPHIFLQQNRQIYRGNI